MSRWWLLALCWLAACGVDWQLRRGQQAIVQMDLPRAEKAFRSALAREPDNVDALYGLGWTYHLAGYGEEARDTFDRCVQIAPDRALGYKGLGSVALVAGNLVVAKERFEQALQRSPADPAILNSLALLHMRAERVEEALAIYEGLEPGAADPAELATGHAEALLRLDRLEEARALVEDALESEPESVRTKGLLLMLHARVLLASTAGRLDSSRCEQTLAPLLAWLVQAERSLDRAELLSLVPPDLDQVRGQVRQRQRALDRICEGGRAAP